PRPGTTCRIALHLTSFPAGPWRDDGCLGREACCSCLRHGKDYDGSVHRVRADFDPGSNMVVSVSKRVRSALSNVAALTQALGELGSSERRKMLSLDSGAYRVGTGNEAARRAWLQGVLSELPAGARILDAGAGERQVKPLCDHL